MVLSNVDSARIRIQNRGNTVISVRLATLQDAAAITAIHTSDVPQWSRIDSEGRSHPAAYSDLTVYERWQHGGPWMSLETCAVHLNRLLAGAGIPLVAVRDGEVLAEAEVYESFEAPPFGHHLEISIIATHTAYHHQGLGTALVEYICQMARLMKCERVTVSDANARGFYEKTGFTQTHTGRGVRFTPQAGRVFYQATPLTERSPLQVKGWYMPFGRLRGSRQEWDRLFPQDWAAGIPEISNRPAEHVKLTISGGQQAILFVTEPEMPDYHPGDLHLTCWSGRPYTPMLLAAIRDWAFKQGYKGLVSYVMDSELPSMGSELQPMPYNQIFFERAV